MTDSINVDEIVATAVREKRERDSAQDHLDRIKDLVVPQALAQGKRSVRLVHSETRKEYHVYASRTGTGTIVPEDRMPALVERLPKKVADRLFPRRQIRTQNANAIEAFVEEQVDDPVLQEVQRELSGLLVADLRWSAKVRDIGLVKCIECDNHEILETETWYLCLEHRAWYRLDRMDADLESGALDRGRFHNRRSWKYRLPWMTELGIAASTLRRHGVPARSKEI